MGLLGLEEGVGPRVPLGAEGEGEGEDHHRGQEVGEEQGLCREEGAGLLLQSRVLLLVF